MPWRPERWRPTGPLVSDRGPAGLSFPAPVLMSYLLMFATGAKRTERHMQDRPGYRDYQQRVAFFFPRPRKDAD